jgi:hypothetical protein
LERAVKRGVEGIGEGTEENWTKKGKADRALDETDNVIWLLRDCASAVDIWSE